VLCIRTPPPCSRVRRCRCGGGRGVLGAPSPAPAAAVGAAFACTRIANDLPASTGRDRSELLDQAFGQAFGQLSAIVSAPAAPWT
jgi:hypothetical protein